MQLVVNSYPDTHPPLFEILYPSLLVLYQSLNPHQLHILLKTSSLISQHKTLKTQQRTYESWF